jgi:hypothetical protein
VDLIRRKESNKRRSQATSLLLQNLNFLPTTQEQLPGDAETSGTEEIPRQPPKPSAPEAPDSEYIKAGHWWGKHVTAAVDT